MKNFLSLFGGKPSKQQEENLTIKIHQELNLKDQPITFPSKDPD